MNHHPPTTPLRAILGLTTIAAAAPDLFGPSNGTVDRRTHAPANDTGHSLMHPASMASFKRGAMAAEGLGGGIGGMVETKIGDTGHVQAETGAELDLTAEAESAAGTFAKQS